MQNNNRGLTSAEADERKRLGQINRDRRKKNNSYLQIIRRNVFTYFNLINAAVAVLILLGGVNFNSLKNVLFLVVVISNTAIGLFQEIRSKRATDRMKVLTKGKVLAVRDGMETEIYTDEIVLGDLLVLTAGSQIPADCEVVDGVCTVDESELTGESGGVTKREGDKMLSGCFVSSGTCHALVTAVGADSYGYRIAREARQIKSKKSDIIRTMNVILAVMSVIIIPLGSGLFAIKFNETHNYSESIISIGAAVIGMLPEGMILLTSTVFALASIMLARRRVMSQDLYSAEALARTDVICVDKTGTLTEGKLEVAEVISLCESIDAEFMLRRFIAASIDRNPTANALRARFGGDDDTSCGFIPFDSEKKCSIARFDDCELTFGAAEFVCSDLSESIENIIEENQAHYRVLILVHTANNITTPVSLVLIRDVIRPEAANTLRYFYNEDVDVKIISGDNPQTVASVAERAGVRNAYNYVDMSTVSDADIFDTANRYTVFGRVTPAQKREIVMALKKVGHTVAMIGDGVNDVLALKESDCPIAPASGTDMARDAAKLVLLDSDFDALPEVVRQGRRSINNLKRSVSLFLIKIVYSLMLSISFLFIPSPYPFQPIHLTIITFFGVAIPGFLLSFEPNNNRVEGRFVVDIITKSIPGGMAIALSVIFCALTYGNYNIPYNEYVTVCVVSSGIVALLNLFKVCWPFSKFRFVVYILMAAAFGVCITLLGGVLFSLCALSHGSAMLLLAALAVAIAVYVLATLITKIIGNSIILHKTE